MRFDDEMDRVEKAGKQLDLALMELRKLAHDVGDEGDSNPPIVRKSAIQLLLEIQTMLRAAIPASLMTIVTIAYAEPDQGDETTAEARKEARKWLITNEILSQQELMVLSYADAKSLVRERTGVDF